MEKELKSEKECKVDISARRPLISQDDIEKSIKKQVLARESFILR